MDTLSRRHIQNLSEAAALEHHWGYADRAVPCTNDAGSCAYLDVVYHSHDLGMLYAGVFWATIGGTLLIWAILHRTRGPTSAPGSITIESLEKSAPTPQSGLRRLAASFTSSMRRYLLPDCLRPIFGRTTRLQVLVLATLVGYLTIWTFVGIVYKTWITPVKKTSLYNTRTSLGPFADRVGILAYALMPFVIMLSSRESVLSLITGLPYQSFNFLHRWLGYVIFAQSVLHTVGWTVIEARLYQPQPKVGREWIQQKYMVWGVVAQIFITSIFVLSLPPVIRLTGYEFFRKAHYVMAMLFIGACWGHWSKLACFMIASLTLWLIDRGVRLARTALIHYNHLPDGSVGFTSARAQLTHFPDDRNGDIVRVDFDYPHDAWSIGQHFYLCFPELGIWQSHPFTPLTPPRPGGTQRHSYIVRSKRGATKTLARLAASKPTDADSDSDSVTTPVILTGPYGESLLSHTARDTNILCIAGGTGITYVLPLLLHLAAAAIPSPSPSPRRIQLIWAVRMSADRSSWIRRELDLLDRRRALTVRIFVTRECRAAVAAVAAPEKPTAQAKSVDSSDSDSDGDSVVGARPDLRVLTADFVAGTVCGPTTVFASGPPGMLADVRGAVARCNRPSQVWRGDGRGVVRYVGDDRGEW